MFNRARNSLKPHFRNTLRNNHSASTSTARIGGHTRSIAAGALGAATGGLTLWYYSSNQIHNDASVPPPYAKAVSSKPALQASSKEKLDPEVLHSLVWGSNSTSNLAPNVPGTASIRTPTAAAWLEGVALRDLRLHENHAACVDARGDVYQWGEGFFGTVEGASSLPRRTLKGKNIIQVQLTDDKLYALSSSGKVYVLGTNAQKQQLSSGASSRSSWLWGEDKTIDFAEVNPSEDLAWGESFVSMAAGKNHFLGLTSKGRVFAHPVNKLANQQGQLGLRKFSIPDPSAPPNSKTAAHLHVELVPKSLADPFVNASRAARITPTNALTSDSLAAVDDKSIRFCTSLFEVPVLKGVEAAQIATGSRTSFLRTTNGRVLAWGANENGQLGLGSNVALDTITVPTEVVLWRYVPNSTESKCLDVIAGGDLTAFVVERSSINNPSTTDVLMSGNGQYGGLGNNTYSNSQGTPTRVKGISGLLQYNDRTKSLESIKPEEISVSPTGHVLVSLNSSGSSEGFGGKDLMVWGKNYESELGNGKKASISQPANIDSQEGERMMLMQRKAREVKDLQGKIWKRGVKVQQRAVAGPQSSVVYWSIV